MFNNGQRVRYSLSTRLIRHLLTMPGLLMFSLLMVSLLIGGIGRADAAQGRALQPSAQNASVSSLNYEPQRVDIFQFNNRQDEQRAFYLARQLRCPKCQNQNLMESNASIALDMKLQVFSMVDKGYSNEDILQFMTDRFGSFVLYEPPFSLKTAFLWCLPLLLFLVLFMFARKLTQSR